jgi:hypothetical protein
MSKKSFFFAIFSFCVLDTNFCMNDNPEPILTIYQSQVEKRGD